MGKTPCDRTLVSRRLSDACIDNDQMKRMERKIQSLEKIVNSLTVDVRDLREIVVAMNGEAASGGPIRRPTTGRDAPNVDVEIYWSDNMDDSGKTQDPRKALDRSEKNMLPLNVSAVSSDSHSAFPTKTTQTKTKSSIPVRVNPGISQNIPPLHPPSFGNHVNGKSTKRMAHDAPQVRDAVVANMIRSAKEEGTSKRAIESVNAHNNDRSKPVGRSMSMINIPTNNLTTQMQRGQIEEKFDSLMKTTLGKMKVGASSHRNFSSKPTTPVITQNSRNKFGGSPLVASGRK